MRILMAGPWIGELGWELCRWQGRVRKQAIDGKYDKIFVGIQEGKEILYKDFATGYIYVPKDHQAEGWMKKNLKNPLFTENNISFVRAQYGVEHKLDLFTPTKHTTGMSHSDQMFIKYGNAKNATGKFDLLVHARWCNKRKTDYRNWPLQKWSDLTSYFKGKLKIASVGSRYGAEHIKNTENLLDVPLEELTNEMAYAKLIIGPSSGPMHLASLCGLTHLVWTNNKKWGGAKGTNRERYETKWNPLRTKCIILDDCNWQPQLSDVIKNVKEYFNL